MYILAEVIGVISEVFIIYIFIQGICPKKECSPIALLLAYAGYGAGLLILSFIGNAAVLRIVFCALESFFWFPSFIPQMAFKRFLWEWLSAQYIC